MKNCQKLSGKLPKTEWENTEKQIRNFQKLGEKRPKTEWETKEPEREATETE